MVLYESKSDQEKPPQVFGIASATVSKVGAIGSKKIPANANVDGNEPDLVSAIILFHILSYF